MSTVANLSSEAAVRGQIHFQLGLAYRLPRPAVLQVGELFDEPGEHGR
jgi:hypothetical protein